MLRRCWGLLAEKDIGLADAIKSYHTAIPIAELRAHAAVYRCPPWVVLQLLTDKSVVLCHPRATEIMEWGREAVLSASRDERSTSDAMWKLNGMWTTLLKHHTVKRQACVSYLGVCVDTCDIASFCSTYAWVKTSQDMWPDGRFIILALRLIRGVSDRDKANAFLEVVLDDIRRGELTKDGTSVMYQRKVCNEVIMTLHALGDVSGAREWLTWQLEEVNKTPDFRVCQLFPEVDWFAAVEENSQTGVMYAPTVEDVVRIVTSPQTTQGSHGQRLQKNLTDAGMVRLCELSTPARPLLKHIVEMLSHKKKTGVAFLPPDYECFVKVLCDDKDAVTAWATVGAMEAAGLTPTTSTYADILACLGTEPLVRDKCLRAIRACDKPYLYYGYALKRYPEHRRGTDGVDALGFLEAELQRVEAWRDGASVCLWDGTFADVVYDLMDTVVCPSVAAKLLAWVCEKCPEIDEVTATALTEFSTRYKAVLHTYTPPREMFNSLDAFREHFTAMRTIYVLDTSVLESAGGTLDMFAALPVGAGAPDVAVVVPFVALRELCASLRALTLADAPEYRAHITDAVRGTIGMATDGRVVLLHPTEDLLARIYSKHVGVDFTKTPLADDDDRVMYTYRFLQSLMPASDVVLVSADPRLLARADREGLKTLVVAGPQEGVLPEAPPGPAPITTAAELIPPLDPAMHRHVATTTIVGPSLDGGGFEKGFTTASRDGSFTLSEYWKKRRVPKSILRDMMNHNRRMNEGTGKERYQSMCKFTQSGMKLGKGAKPFYDLPMVKVNVCHPANRHYLDDYKRLMGKKKLFHEFGQIGVKGWGVKKT